MRHATASLSNVNESIGSVADRAPIGAKKREAEARFQRTLKGKKAQSLKSRKS